MRVPLPAALEARRPVAVEGPAAKDARDLALDERDGAAVVSVAAFALVLLGDLVVKLLELGVEGRGPVRDGVARGLESRGSFFFFFFYVVRARGGREKKKKGASRREKKKRRKKKTTSWLEGKCVPSSSLSLTLMSPVGGRGAGEGLSGASGEEEREEEEVVEEEEEETAEEKLSMLLDEDAARRR